MSITHGQALDACMTCARDKSGSPDFDGPAFLAVWRDENWAHKARGGAPVTQAVPRRNTLAVVVQWADGDPMLWFGGGELVHTVERHERWHETAALFRRWPARGWDDLRRWAEKVSL